MALELTINGQRRHFEPLGSGATLKDLIAALDLKSDRVALEHNGELAPRSGWAERALSEGDKVEIVHFVGGGSSTKL